MVEEYVSAGGGLLVLCETEQKKYGDNLDELLAPYGVRTENTTVFDYAGSGDAPTWVTAVADAATDSPEILHRVPEARFYRAGTLTTEAPGAVVLRSGAAAAPADAPLMAAVSHGRGRVVVASDSDLFGDDFVGRHAHLQLWLNVVLLARLAGVRPGERAASLHGRRRPRLGSAPRRDGRAATAADPDRRGRSRGGRRAASPACTPRP